MLRSSWSPLGATRHRQLFHLETHGTLAFASGYALDRAQGEIFPAQAHRVWRLQAHPVNLATPLWTFRQEQVGEGKDVAVELNVTHDIALDVDAYLKRGGSNIGKRVSCILNPIPGPLAVRDADHAFALASTLIRHLRSLRSDFQPGARFHFFFAAPNFLMFILGRQARILGSLQLYEYDATPNVLGNYYLSLHLP